MERFVKAIEEHTKALLVHAEALAKVGLAKVESAVEGAKPRGRKAAGESDGVTADPKSVAVDVVKTASTATNSAQTVTASGAAAPAGLLDPKALAALFVSTAKAKGAQGRDFVTGILKEFNAATLDKITAEQQPAFVARLNGQLPEATKAAVADDLAGLLG